MIEILLVANLDMILFNKPITKTLIRLHKCAGWSAPVLFAHHRRQVFSLQGPYFVYASSKGPGKTCGCASLSEAWMLANVINTKI